MSDDSGEKTEEATQQRRDDFRKRGQVAQTRELASVFMLFSSVILIWVLSRFFMMNVIDLFNRSMGDEMVAMVREGNFMTMATYAGSRLALLLAPVLATVFVLSFASTVLQVGILHNEEALQWKWERLDPVAGFKRMFAARAFIEGFKALIKMSIILTLCYFLLRGHVQRLPELMDYSIPEILAFLGSLTVRLLSGVGFFMLCLAGLDYFYQRYDLEKQMRMSKQEIKEEHKSREGDPMIKARIKRIQREMSQRRMMDEVPKADVIVTNPTHIAVALKYADNMVAPMIVAMGADHVAQKIREIARENNVPIVENKPLARAMFKTLKIGEAIPRELYTAVAEVLSYVYRLRRKKGN